MISSHGQTDVRKRRSLNEGAVFASDQLFIVCDGFDAKSQELTDGNIVLRCSDGQTNMPPDRRILEIVSTPGADLEGACRVLVSEADAQGGRDNIRTTLGRHTA